MYLVFNCSEQTLRAFGRDTTETETLFAVFSVPRTLFSVDVLHGFANHFQAKQIQTKNNIDWLTGGAKIIADDSVGGLQKSNGHDFI